MSAKVKVALSSLASLSIIGAAAAQERPNILIILADDMGYADAGFTGATDIKTPNLDRLAAEGAVCTQGYTNHPFSGPSRAAILSGRYPHRFGFEWNPANDPANPLLGLSLDETLFSQRVKAVGYTTGIIGKWHIGSSPAHMPNSRGFDYFYGFPGGGHDYFKIDIYNSDPEGYKAPLMRNNQPASFDGYLTDAFSRDAVQFIRKNKEKPFMLYLAYNAPHGPQQAPKADIERYSHIENRTRRIYAAQVDVMDRGIGEVVDELKAQGLYENTIIFFMSDNGGPGPYNPNNPWHWNGSSNGAFRGGKTDMFEGGIHVPFMVCWPNGIKAGTQYDYPVHAIDVSRTAVELAGGDPLSGNAMEGVNLEPYLNGKNKKAPHEAIYWRGVTKWAVVDSKGMKLVNNKGGKAEPMLFDLRKDVSEQNDLKQSKTKEADALKDKWDRWNEGNIDHTILNYINYHKMREEFFKNATPEGFKQMMQNKKK